MTTDEIIAMLASIGVAPDRDRPRDWKGFVAVFERFAALVAAKEREACAMECERVAAKWGFHMVAPSAAINCMDAIRARGMKEGA